MQPRKDFSAGPAAPGAPAAQARPLARALRAILGAAGVALYAAAGQAGGAGRGPFSGGGLLGLEAILFLAFLAAYAVLETVNRPRLLATLSLAFLAAKTAVACCLAWLVDEAWFGFAFLLALQYFSLFIRRYRSYGTGPRLDRALIARVYSLSLVVFCMVGIWLLALGTATALGRGPRLAASLPLDLYWLMLAFDLFFSAVRLKRLLWREIRVHGGKVFIDGYEFSHFITPLGAEVLGFLMSRPGGRASCGEMVRALGTEGKTGDEDECGDCIVRAGKTTACRSFRKLYLTILELKKLLETLEIGTILAPENKFRIRDEGWRLRISGDVRQSADTQKNSPESCSRIPHSPA
jgi:hypothetical protein